MVNRRPVQTLNVPLYKGNTAWSMRGRGKYVHLLAIRSDWTEADWEDVRKQFEGTYTCSASLTMPVWFLGRKYHNTDFRGCKKFHDFFIKRVSRTSPNTRRPL